MSLDQKINEVFGGLVVRKDLAKEIRGNAIVPTFVLEYLLGQFCTTDDEATIREGINSVKTILQKHYVHRSESELIRSNIKEKGRQKVIDKISVQLNDKKDAYEATFANLGINKVIVDSSTIKQHPKLLVSGIWCIADVEYYYSEDKDSVPWLLNSLRPIQLSAFDMDAYLAGRQQFTTDEWIDLLVQSIGFNPALFSRRNKLLQIVRLISFCERNYNLMELGPKGTGKSHIFSEFSPHGILISGGEVTVPKLFVNNSNGKIGLVGFWDCVAFDEFAGHDKRIDKALVDIMKNYMANKSFSRGIETLGAEASMAFVGNTQHNVPHMLSHSNLFADLPDKFYDSAFLDRIHFYVPGWEVDIIRGEMFSSGYGFVVDYLAEILRHLRNYDYSDRYQQYFTLSSEISTRDWDGINKTFSGLMKLLFPNGEATEAEINELLTFAMEGRKRVKDQLMRIDSTYAKVDFSFYDKGNNKHVIQTLEEREYPTLYYRTVKDGVIQVETPPVDVTPASATTPASTSTIAVSPPPEPKLKEGHIVFKEGQRGVSYKSLFGDYLKGVTHIDIKDSYLRNFHQVKNLMDFILLVAEQKNITDEVVIDLQTTPDDMHSDKQIDNFDKIQSAVAMLGIKFNWQFATSSIHARSITLDNGWKISMDRGFDIFIPYDNDAFSLESRMQEMRRVKDFEVTYIKVK